MSHQSLFEKLELTDERNLLIQGLPSSIEKQFIKLSYSKNVTPLLNIKKIDFALVFAINGNQLNGILSEVIPAMHDEGKLWVAYPKTSSKISSDLNRDCSWRILVENQYETIAEVALDHVWSALQFKRSEAGLAIEDLDIEVDELVEEEEFDKEILVLPAVLEKVFTRNKKARECFESLPESHQNEYLVWIEGAKREDTRTRRVAATVEKLLAGKKSPTEK